ncbi:MAG: hypothetical protein AAGI66_03420 [Cyanobacteria bacterium P01_H01_bin.74]
MVYQLCRWYDLYPRLSFALKLLYLSPATVQAKANHQLIILLKKTVENELVNQPPDHVSNTTEPKQINLTENSPAQNRWYDDSSDSTNAFEVLKKAPDFVKHQVADLLLNFLMEETA